jgi:hypothetical protein
MQHLPCSVPYIEDQLPTVGVELKWVHLYAERGNVFFLELSCKMALHKGGLADASITN